MTALEALLRYATGMRMEIQPSHSFGVYGLEVRCVARQRKSQFATSYDSYEAAAAGLLDRIAPEWRDELAARDATVLDLALARDTINYLAEYVPDEGLPEKVVAELGKAGVPAWKS